jgi:O-antigen/teichoic acid export membrane protein
MLVDLFHKKEISKLEKLTDNLAKVVIMVILPITIGGILLSKEIILLFGQKYITAYLPFSILMIYTFLLFIRELYGYGLNAWHMEKKYLRVVAVSALINLTLNLIFTPRFGMNIAAIITVISEVINFILMKHYAEKVVKINSFKYILKALIPTLIMTAFVLLFKYLNVNIIINIIVAAIVYIAAIIGFKYMSIDEIKSFLLRKNGV